MGDSISFAPRTPHHRASADTANCERTCAGAITATTWHTTAYNDTHTHELWRRFEVRHRSGRDPLIPGLCATGLGDTKLNVVTGNFNPCATLSTVLVTFGATGGAPIHALMFHNGTYVGTATKRSYAFRGFDASDTTDTTVVLSFLDVAGSCNACSDAIYKNIGFRWEGKYVQMLGTPNPQYEAS